MRIGFSIEQRKKNNNNNNNNNMGRGRMMMREGEVGRKREAERVRGSGGC
jgi:hypothetical protein